MSVKPVPDGYNRVIPYLVVGEIPPVIEFLQAAFAAHLDTKITLPDGDVRHAELTIGDSKVMMGKGSEEWPAAPASLYLYVEDVDAAFERAVAAGGQTMMPPMDQFYGDRMCGVVGPQGNAWFIASRVENVAPDELQRRAIENEAARGEQ